MIKVMYIVSTLEKCGPINQLYNIISHLDLDLFEPRILTLSPEKNQSMKADFDAISVAVDSLNLPHLKGFFFSKNKLKEKINSFCPGIIHSQGFRADVIAARFFSKHAKVATIRNFPHEDYTMTYGHFIGRLMSSIHMHVIRKKHVQCVAVSPSVQKNLNEKMLILGVEVVENGVDLDKFWPVSKKKKSLLRSKYDIPDRAKVFIVSGGLTIRKDPIFLIDFWKRCCPANGENHIIFIGDGELEEKCAVETAGVENIHMMGAAADVSEYLQLSDFFLSSSKAEGLPNAALEALACGLPVILSDIGPHIDLLSVSPSIGYAFTTGDKTSLQKTIKNALAADYGALRETALNESKNKFSASTMSKKYQNIYLRLTRSQL